MGGFGAPRAGHLRRVVPKMYGEGASCSGERVSTSERCDVLWIQN